MHQTDRKNEMPNKTFLRLIVFSILLSLSFQVGALEIIVNDSVSHKALPIETVTAIFRGRKKHWKEGKNNITVVLFKGTDKGTKLNRNLCINLLGIGYRGFSQEWKQSIYSIASKKPIYVDSRQEMIKIVSSTPGAIGFIDLPTEGDGYHVLQID